jgi:hypothetical protein
MSIVALPAHFDGKRICLDEPFDLKPNARLIVTVLPTQESRGEHKDWLRLSGRRLEDAYGENEPEYSPDMIREKNPGYGAR